MLIALDALAWLIVDQMKVGQVTVALVAVALGFLLAGVAGNLTDRLLREPAPLRGHVIDFFMLPHWPVFNVADMLIDAAAILILIQVFRGVRLDGSRATGQSDEQTGERAE